MMILMGYPRHIERVSRPTRDARTPHLQDVSLRPRNFILVGSRPQGLQRVRLRTAALPPIRRRSLSAAPWIRCLLEDRRRRRRDQTRARRAG